MELTGFDLQGFIRDKYKNCETVKLLNPWQCHFYMTRGVYPLWVEPGYDHKIVYVFLKEPTLRLFSEWRKENADWKRSHSEN